MMFSKKLYKPSTNHSQKFCRTPGIGLGLRIAVCARMMMAAATIQVTSIEFVIPNPPNSTSSCGFNETPSCSVGAASAAKLDVAGIALEANARSDISKQRLRILVSYSCSRHRLYRHAGSSIRFRPTSPKLLRKSCPGYNLNAHNKANFPPDDKQNTPMRTILRANPRQTAERFVRRVWSSPVQ